jgi:hypothetical protein
MKSQSVKCIMVCVVGALALLSGRAAKANSETFSPALCGPMLSGTAAYSRSVSGFSNSSGASMYVTCPIVRTDTENTNGLNWAAAYIYNPSGKTTTCSLWARDVLGNYMGGSSVATQSTSSAGGQALYFGSALSTTQEWSTYTLFCTLPAGGGINSYTIFEN